MSSIIDVEDMTTTALPQTSTMSSRLATTGSITTNTSSIAATISNSYQELLERVIRRENTSVIRVVWYVIEQTKRGHKEVEASYSQLQTALNLSRCGVSLGVSRALEAGYIVRTNTSAGGGNSGGKGRNNNGGSAGGNGDHATARYVVNLPVVTVTPTDALEQDTKSVNQTDNHNADADNGNGANDISNNEGKQEAREEQSVSQTAFNQTASAVLSYDSNIESLLELEVESDMPVDTTVGKPDRRRASTQPGAEAVWDEDEDEDEGDDNEPAGGTSAASTPTPSEAQEQPHQPEQPHAQVQERAEAGAKERSEYLANLSQDFSRELGDLAHGRSNLTQIHNLWRESGLSEKEFAGLLYQSRDLTRRYAVLRPGETPPPGGKPRNRMAYFFTVVRNMLGLGSATAPVAIASATSASASAVVAPTQISTRPNSHYGHNAGEYEYKQKQTQAQTHKLPTPGSSMVSPQPQAAGLRHAPGASSGASVSVAASASSTASRAGLRSSRYQEWTPANDKAKVQAEKAHGKVKTQAVAPNGVKLLHASWLQFVR
jgi:hypothetical protein